VIPSPSHQSTLNQPLNHPTEVDSLPSLNMSSSSSRCKSTISLLINQPPSIHIHQPTHQGADIQRIRINPTLWPQPLPQPLLRQVLVLVRGIYPYPIQFLIIGYIHPHQSPYTPIPSRLVMVNPTVSTLHLINTLTPLVGSITSLNPSGLNLTKSSNPTHGTQIPLQSMKMVISLDMNMKLHHILSFHTCTPPNLPLLNLNLSQTSNNNINTDQYQYHSITRPIRSLLRGMDIKKGKMRFLQRCRGGYWGKLILPQ